MIFLWYLGITFYQYHGKIWQIYVRRWRGFLKLRWCYLKSHSTTKRMTRVSGWNQVKIISRGTHMMDTCAVSFISPSDPNWKTHVLDTEFPPSSILHIYHYWRFASYHYSVYVKISLWTCSTCSSYSYHFHVLFAKAQAKTTSWSRRRKLQLSESWDFCRIPGDLSQFLWSDFVAVIFSKIPSKSWISSHESLSLSSFCVMLKNNYCSI